MAPNRPSAASPAGYSGRRNYGRSATPATASNDEPNPAPPTIRKTQPNPLLPAFPISPPPSPATIQSISAGPISLESMYAGMLSPCTIKAYKNDLCHFIQWLDPDLAPGKRDDSDIIEAIRKIDRNMAAEYRNKMQSVDKYAPATINRRLSNVNSLMKRLAEDGYISINVFSRVKRMRIGRSGRTPAFSKEDAEKLLAIPDRNTPIGRRNRIILLLMFFGGLRASEVIGVDSEDFVQDKGHTILRVKGKGHSAKDDYIKIPARIWPEIRAFILECGNGPLFKGESRNHRLNKSDRGIGYTRLYLLIKEMCRKAGVDSAFSPHSTRASFVTQALAQKCSIYSVMRAARHASADTTLLYDRNLQDLNDHPADKLKMEENASVNDC